MMIMDDANKCSCACDKGQNQIDDIINLILKMSYYSSLNIHIDWMSFLPDNEPWCGEIKREERRAFPTQHLYTFLGL